MFDVFHRRKERLEPEDTTTRLERLEKTVKMLEIEWNETYDKFRQLHMRVAKRVQRLDEAESQEDTGHVAETPGDPSSGLPSNLSPRARVIQQQILERRNRLQKGVPE
jgi:hypothetical protein